MKDINDIIKLLHADGKSLREIADAVNLSHIAVRKRLLKMPVEEKLQPDENGRISTDQYPKLHKALMQVDDILAGIQKQIGEPISIETPGGWKIDRVPVNRLY